jgi:hypothetical protein
MRAISSSGLLRLIQGGGLGDPWAPWCTWEGIDDERGGADQTFVHRRRRLESAQLLHEGLVNAATKLAARLGSHRVGWRGIDLRVSEAPGIPDGNVGATAMADILIGGAQFMLEPLQGEQDAYGNGTSATGGGGGEPLLTTWLDGAHHCRPGKGLSPLTEGMRRGHPVGDVQSCSRTAQPMLKTVHKAHRGLSCSTKGREPQDTMRRSTGQVPMSNGEKTSDHYIDETHSCRANAQVVLPPKISRLLPESL